MNMAIDLMNPRIQAHIQKLVLELISELGIEECDSNVLLDDPEIYETLQKKARAAVATEDENRKQKIIAAAKKQLGIVGIKKPEKVFKPIVPAVLQQPESAWQKYLSDGSHSLSNSLVRLETHEEVSAARGFLIAVLTRHRQNSDWVKEELQESVGVWHKRVQIFLDVFNNFFGKKEDIPVASSEVYSRVSSLLESEQDLRWYMNGPAGIQVELDAKKRERESAQQKVSERQQRKEALGAKKYEIVELLVSKNVLKEDAEKLAAATVRKFPELEIEEAMLKMAINRQVSAIQKNRGFLDEVAPGAQQYFSGSGVSENKFFLEISQHTEVISLLNRDAADLKICRR